MLVVLQNLDPRLDIGGVLKLSLHPEMRAEIRRTDFRDQFLDRVSFLAETLPEHTLTPLVAARPVRKFVEDRGVVSAHVFELALLGHHDGVQAGTVAGTVATVSDFRTGITDETLDGLILAHDGRNLFRGSEILGKPVTLRHVENRVGAAKRDRLLLSRNLVVLFQELPENDLGALLALADHSAIVPALIEREPT